MKPVEDEFLYKKESDDEKFASWNHNHISMYGEVETFKGETQWKFKFLFTAPPVGDAGFRGSAAH